MWIPQPAESHMHRQCMDGHVIQIEALQYACEQGTLANLYNVP